MMANELADNVTILENFGPTVLIGRYRMVRHLGQGGMGSVWLAEDLKLDGRKVAIKMLPSILVCNKRAYAQVKKEVLVSLKLSHPNIVTVRAFEEENGNPFLVMDYIDGQTLDDYLAEKGKLTEAETIKLLKPVAAALDYAHAQGIIHRDIKPGNVMIRRDGVPFVLDFGIAREIQETMTRVTGKLSSGTLMYMSPEQLHGVTPKSAQDVYSFAAMVYECLKGEPPFSRGQIEYQIEHDTPESLVPQFAKCGPGVMAGLAKTPDARPASCAAVLAADEGSTSQSSRQSPSEFDRGIGLSSASANAQPDLAEMFRLFVQAKREREQVALLLEADKAEFVEELRDLEEDFAAAEDAKSCAANGAAVTLVARALAKINALKAKIKDRRAKVEEEQKCAVQLWKDGPYWAECNVGATKPEETGYYFWWGDTVGYQRNSSNNGWVSVKNGEAFSFKKGNCSTADKSISQLQLAGYIDATGNLVPKYDAATVHWGPSWRMPTQAEFDALVKNCDIERTECKGVAGWRVKGRGSYSSRSIFFPAAGYGNDAGLYNFGSYGFYWSFTPNSGGSDRAWSLGFYSGDFYRYDDYRYYGQSVRPVQGR